MAVFVDFVKRVVHDSIQGPNGYDPVRILFAIGGTNGVVCPVIFQTWAQWTKGPGAWDVTAWCLAYGGMLSAIVAAGGITMGIKDRGSAKATAIRDANAPVVDQT